MPSIIALNSRFVPCTVLISALILVLSGCAESEFNGVTSSRSVAPAAGETYAAPKEAVVVERGSLENQAKSGQIGSALPAAIARKIIYNAQIALVVEDVTKLDAEIVRLVKDAGGYISGSDISGAANLQRTANWTVRMPVEGFAPFVDRISRLGEVQRNHVDSQDVTQEYVDVEARIGNKQKEETRLQKHLIDSTGKLEEILLVERELTRVRGEIEQAQGRLRYLANLSSLSTITITATEIHDYKPPVRPTFAGRIRQTFDGSVESLVAFVQGLILLIVSIAPWIPVIVVLGLPVLWLSRRIYRRSGRA